MLFNLECATCLLHLQAKHNVQVFCLGCRLFVILTARIELRIVSILYKRTGKLAINIYINAILNEVFVKFVDSPIFTREVYHRTSFALLVYHKQRRNTCSFCYKCVVGTKSRCDVYDTCTIFGSYIVARNYAETVFVYNSLTIYHINRLNPWE